MAEWIDARIHSFRRSGSYGVKTITIAAARALLEKARENGLTGMSKVNPQFTRQQAYDIFAGMLGEMGNVPDDTKLNHLAAKNLVREFG